MSVELPAVDGEAESSPTPAAAPLHADGIPGAPVSASPPGPTGDAEDQKNNASQPHFDDLHAEYLRERAVPLDLAYAAGVRSTTGEIAAQALQRAHPIDCRCLGILYPGHQPPYMRVRLDDPEVAGGAVSNASHL